MFTIKIAQNTSSIEIGNPSIDLMELYEAYKDYDASKSFCNWLQTSLPNHLNSADIFFTDYDNLVIYWNSIGCQTAFIKLFITEERNKCLISDIESVLDEKLLDAVYDFIQECNSNDEEYEHNLELFTLVCKDSYNYTMLHDDFSELAFYEACCDKYGDISEKGLVDWARDCFEDCIDYEAVFKQYDSWGDYARDVLYDYTIYQSVTDRYTCWICRDI